MDEKPDKWMDIRTAAKGQKLLERVKWMMGYYGHVVWKYNSLEIQRCTSGNIKVAVDNEDDG